jgi:hypothetical protein
MLYSIAPDKKYVLLKEKFEVRTMLKMESQSGKDKVL